MGWPWGPSLNQSAPSGPVVIAPAFVRSRERFKWVGMEPRTQQKLKSGLLFYFSMFSMLYCYLIALFFATGTRDHDSSSADVYYRKRRMGRF